ncbi:MAG TPA: cellulase family glycosylhydrolase [Flavobacterium sp.]|nr:cellulase family glycosylhydrolase [Flavobacterium sp.]HRA72480.1 cellulase family glycosylhydrolase [Flavobacterium sp.]
MKNRLNKQYIFTFLTVILFGIFSCSSDSGSSPDVKPTAKTLSVDVNSIDFLATANSKDIIVTTNVTTWTISSSDTSWIQLSKTSGVSGSTSVTVAATENKGITARSATISVSSSQAPTVTITVSQAAPAPVTYPSYNTNPIAADATGMSSTAVQLAAKIKLGWNIGNTLEATGGETAWGNPKVTKALIDLVKANGFNAIRIPCSWNQNMANSSTAQIKADWLNRVKEVVQYCVDNDMYVLVNIHWDGGWLENNCTNAKKVENNAKQKAFWEQIATSLRDFDEHLLFASANEPNVDDATQMDVLNSYHQTFIDAVRATGGKNANRILVVQGPSTDIDKTNKLMLTLPVDNVANRMMVEVHYYTPWNFCGMEKDESWGKMFYYWGANYHSTTDTARNATYGEEADLDNLFKSMKTQFVDKGIPVILGEFGAIRRSNLTGSDLTLHLDSRAFFLKYVVKQAKANGMLPFYWDAGGMGNNGSAIFNRTNNTIFDNQALTGLLDGLK